MGRGAGPDASGSSGLAVAILSHDDAGRRTIAAVLTGSGFIVHAEAPDVDEFLARLHGKQPDCIVVQEAEGADAGAVIRHLRSAFPSTPIVSIAESPARRVVIEKLDAGADGIVLEGQFERQLSPVIRAVCSGQLSLPRELRSSFGKPRLSPREKQVLSMVVMGFTNREIANKLYLAESTIKSHLSSAFEKLGVRSRNDATALILDSTHGLGTGILSILEEETAVASPTP